jgi:hypothetical protein
MSLDILSRVESVELSDPEFEGELDRPWAENIVTAAAAVLTVAMVSSVARADVSRLTSTTGRAGRAGNLRRTGAATG